MKRFRVSAFDFDSRPLMLAMEIKDEWEEQVKALHRANKERMREDYLCEFGPRWSEQKLRNIVDLGPKPLSIIAFHNKFLEQARHAFIVGAYYPALTAACALGERILNHLVLLLREDFRATPEYKGVSRKKSFDNWQVPIRALEAWSVLLPEASESFRALEAVRHRSIHFDPAMDHDDRPLALQALNHLNDIVSRQFGAHGPHPWFIPGIAGASYNRKAAEAQPFVRRVYIPNCQLVGPRHTISAVGSRFEVSDAHDYEDREVTDEEFRELLGATAGA